MVYFEINRCFIDLFTYNCKFNYIIMKKTFLFLLLSYAMSSAQVKIGENASVPPDNSEAFRVEASNKGLLIPNVFIPDLNQAPPVTNPADFLLVYNTNEINTKGFYYWNNNKWNPIIDALNIFTKLKLIKYYSVESNSAIVDRTTNGSQIYTINEPPSAHDWQLIPGVTKTIEITSPNNEIGFFVSGVVQRNRREQGDSYAIAIFVDGELKATRGFILNGSNCAYNNFNVEGVLKNLSVGSHTFEVRETYRSELRNGNTTAELSFGGRHTQCSNLNDELARTIMNIQVTQS